MGEQKPDDLESILDHILATAADDSAASVDDLLDAFGSRAFGPLLVIPGLLMLTPLGAVPFVPATLSVFVVLVSAQKALGFAHPWLPWRLRERSVERAQLERSVSRARPWARRIDRVLKPRLRFLTGPPFERGLAAIATLLAASIVFIGFVPLAAAAPASGVLLIGLALTTNDGLVAALAFASLAGTAWLAVSFV